MMSTTPYYGGACACVKQWTLRAQFGSSGSLPRARVVGGSRKRADGVRCEVRARTGGREARLPAVSSLSSPHRRSTSATANRVAATRAKAGDEPESASKALAIFVSGGGSNLKRLHEATQDGRIAGHVAVRKRRQSPFEPPTNSGRGWRHACRGTATTSCSSGSLVVLLHRIIVSTPSKP